MVNNNERFTATIEVNARQAHSELDRMTTEYNAKMERLRVVSGKRSKEAKAEAEQLRRETNLLNKQIQQQKKYIDGLDKVMGDLAGKTYNDLRNEVRQLNKLMRDGTLEKGSQEWKETAEHIKKCKEEMRLYEQAVEQPPKMTAWQKFTKFLNDSWGGVTVLASSIAGLSMTIRKSVKDYADMEEQMADVRKYTGLTADQVKELNEEFKRTDTRTSREQLNQLAGAAGRLGITSKEGIMDFVDAADKISVALGDDLGDGAVDQIGKLAMAFGEDERLGLRGAMLATGSAINELAQNSAAKAGYLVEFAARVAGAGKQLGLTQAQIMGFATVMDEALLQDEMASTAFSQMITKMATDSAKFAQFAGMEASKFAELVKTDLNGAILALADNIRQQDPEIMLKMFGDMGLDGTRAVGVLTNMADKIDDVRRHQQTANEAYEKGTSVIGEFSTMNETVQAKLDKCKKQFQEMTIELGEKLMPVVKYTISSFSLMVKGLSVATSFVLENKAALASAAAGIATYTAYVKAAAIATKAHAVTTKIAETAMKAFNLVTKMNPVGLLIAALTAATVLFIKYRDRINGASEATSMLRQAGARLTGVLAQVTGWTIKLVKWAVSLYDKFSFVRKIIQLLTTAFTAGFSTITNGVKLLIDELGAVANIIEGMFTLDWDKIKGGFRQGFKAVADAAIAQFSIVKREVKDIFAAPPPANGAKAVAAGEQAGNGAGSNELPEVVVSGKKGKTGNKLTEYKTEAERKEEEQELKKREAEEEKRLKERTKAAKAEHQAALAAEMAAYMKGAMTYDEYLKAKHRKTQDYYEKLKGIYGEDSDEYKRLLDDRAREEQQYNTERAKWTEQSLIMEHLDKERSIRRQYLQREVQDEDALNQALFENDVDYMRKKQKLYESDPKRWVEMEMEIRQKEKDEQFRKEQAYMDKLQKFREESGRLNYDKLQEIELEGAKAFYGALLEQGNMTKEEYDAIIEHIKRKYAELKGEQAANSDIQSKASNGLDTAKKNAGVKDIEAGNDAATGIFAVSQAVSQQKLINEQLKQLYGEDYENNREYQEAKRQLDAETMQTIVAGAQAAYSSISSLMSAASSYAQACSDAEVARISKNYEDQIAAAGNNSKMRAKLEKERDKEIAKAKTAANAKAMKIELAQAIAQSALGAISAYSSTMAGAPYPANLVLAPISAGIALAAGALQIATIKKQHEAETAGYYEGGFTGGHRYRKEAGVVHEGEFVANHKAVQNPNIQPFLSFLDHAQRNNTVGSLTAADVSRQLAQGASSAPVLAPVINVQAPTDERLTGELAQLRGVNEELTQILSEPILCVMSMDEFDKDYRHYKKLKS